jgi:hypothetical protein
MLFLNYTFKVLNLFPSVVISTSIPDNDYICLDFRVRTHGTEFTTDVPSIKLEF